MNAAVLAFPAAERPPHPRGGLFRLWRGRSRRRAELRRLLATSPHLVADIGLAPRAAAAEAEKPFWRA